MYGSLVRRLLIMQRVAQEITNGLHNLLPTPTPTVAATSPGQAHPAGEHSGGVKQAPTPNIDLTATFAPLKTTQSHGDKRNGPWLTIADIDYYVNYVLGGVELDAETTVGLVRQ